MNTLSAVVTAFVLGLCMSSLRGKTIGDTLYNGVSDFSGIIDCVLHKVIIPLLPLYICGTFTVVDQVRTSTSMTFYGRYSSSLFPCTSSASHPVRHRHLISHGLTFDQIRHDQVRKNLGALKQKTAFPLKSTASPFRNIHMAGSMSPSYARPQSPDEIRRRSPSARSPFIMTLGIASSPPGAPGLISRAPFPYKNFGPLARPHTRTTAFPTSPASLTAYCTRSSFRCCRSTSAARSPT